MDQVQGDEVGIETMMLAATLGSGVLAGVGAVKQGQAADAAAQSQSNVLRAQAIQEEARATSERAIAQRKAEEETIKAERLMGRQRAVAAASGAGTGGSAAEIEGDTAAEGKFQSELQLWQGEERGKGLDFQAGLDRVAADDKRAQGRAAKKASYIQAGSQILGAVGNAYALAGKMSPGGGSGSGTYYGDKTASSRGIY